MRVWLIYARKSVVQSEKDLESPERQIFICKSHLEMTETEPFEVRIYQDLDRSGYSESGRDDWRRLKEDVRSPDVAGVVAASLDRIYRNVHDFLSFMDYLEKLGKSLKAVRQNFDTSSPWGRYMVINMMALFEMESLITSTKMKEMIDDKRRRFGRHWGVAPFGTIRKGGNLIPSPDSYDGRYYHDALVQCYQFYATGLCSYEQVAFALNADGAKFRDRAGMPVLWTEDRVRGVINRWRLYRGDLPLGNPLKAHDLEWIENAHPPILPIELCDAVGAVLNERSRKLWNRTGEARRIYIMSDCTYCYSCGGRITGAFDHGHRVYRHKLSRRNCSEKWIDARMAEEALLEAITEFAHHPAIVSDILAIVGHGNSDIRAAEKQITDHRRKLDLLVDLYLSGDIDKDNYLSRRQQITGEIDRLVTIYGSENDPAQIAGDVVKWLASISGSEPRTQKLLVFNIFSRIELGGETIQRITPQEWALPFFASCCRWAGWESNPTNTTLKLTDLMKHIEPV